MSDLISRQAAIDALEEQLDYLQMLNKDDNPTAESKWYGLNWARNTIADLPSAQPEQKSGKWIYDGVKRICPFCKDFIVTGRSIVKYCWNCGARLKERSEDGIH